MTETTTEQKSPPGTQPAELFDEVRESARTGQHAAAEALRKFSHTLDEAIPPERSSRSGRRSSTPRSIWPTPWPPPSISSTASSFAVRIGH